MSINKAASKLLAAIKAEHDKTADVVPSGWFTIKQLSGELKNDVRTVQRGINRMLDCGKWKMRRFRIKTGDKIYPVPHYREAK
jgi:predicted transcriptional regulator